MTTAKGMAKPLSDAIKPDVSLSSHHGVPSRTHSGHSVSQSVSQSVKKKTHTHTHSRTHSDAWVPVSGAVDRAKQASVHPSKCKPATMQTTPLANAASLSVRPSVRPSVYLYKNQPSYLFPYVCMYVCMYVLGETGAYTYTHMHAE